MKFIDNLRKAEKKGSSTIRRGVERAREEWADAERRLRQRMRIYPQKPRAMAAAASAGTGFEIDETNAEMPPRPARKPIVSVDGHDLTDD